MVILHIKYIHINELKILDNPTQISIPYYYEKSNGEYVLIGLCYLKDRSDDHEAL